MTLPSVGIRSIALSFPKTIRTNDYYRKNHPELIAQVEEKTLAMMFSFSDYTPANEYDEEMMPYLKDPFRGSVERRVVGPDETSLTLSYKASVDALEAAKMSIEEIDLLLVATLIPEQLVPGNAAYLAGQLGMRGAAWNIDSTCSSAVTALHNACALVRAGEFRNVLVVVCTNYSPFADENDTISFLSGDGAAACVVSSVKPNQGYLGSKIINTAPTCGLFGLEKAVDAQGNHRLFIRAGGKGIAKVASEISVKSVRECCEGALAAAGVTKDQIDFFAFYTPTAWYRNTCVRVLGIDPERTIDLHDRYANAGPVLSYATLYHAQEAGKIKENDLVLLYCFGAATSAAAVVLRWGDVALGPAPALPVSLSVPFDKVPSLR